MPPPIVMMIRHGEKPPDFGNGVDDQGNTDDYSLAVRGWSRAGALIKFFSEPKPPIVRPGIIYAATPVSKGKSLHGRRPLETVQQLAAAANITLDSTFAVGQEAALGQKVLEESRPVIVSWEHHALTDIAARLIPGFSDAFPDRFDLVWLFSLKPDSSYGFSAINQALLPSDAP